MSDSYQFYIINQTVNSQATLEACNLVEKIYNFIMYFSVLCLLYKCIIFI